MKMKFTVPGLGRPVIGNFELPSLDFAGHATLRPPFHTRPKFVNEADPTTSSTSLCWAAEKEQKIHSGNVLPLSNRL